jgi:hypothetical protein
VALWKSLPEASAQMARNEPSTKLIKATSCVKRSNATMEAEELSQLFSYQTLTMDKYGQSYQSPKKIVKKLMLMTIHSCLLQLFPAKWGI